MENSQKGFIVPLLLAIIAILLVGGGAYVYMQNKQTNQSAVVSPTSQTANWKTYTNTKYGFESKYPESYSIFHTSGDSNVSFRSSGCKTLVSGGGEWPADCQAYDVVVQQIKMTSEGYDISKIDVDGIQAEKITAYNGMWDNMTQVVVQFQKGQNWYIQTFTFNQGKSQVAEGIMGQILSTFKFNP